MNHKIAAIIMTTVLAGHSASAGIINVSWEQQPTLNAPQVFNLYANVTADVRITNADLGNTNINELPGGINNGLYSTSNPLSLPSAFTPKLGNESIFILRQPAITFSGTGSHLDASWMFAAGATPEINPLGGHRILLGAFQVNPGTTLGGPNGGPSNNTQSRIFLGWAVGTNGFGGVFDIPTITAIPAPSPLAALALATLTTRKRKRKP